jgi:hypothetical protein
VIKTCCDLYVAPENSPNLKTDKCNLIIEQFRARSLYLLNLSNVDFAMKYLALLPLTLPDPSLPRDRFVQDLLKEEFGMLISEQLISLPASEITKARNKKIAANNTRLLSLMVVQRGMSTFDLGPRSFRRALSISA